MAALNLSVAATSYVVATTPGVHVYVRICALSRDKIERSGAALRRSAAVHCLQVNVTIKYA